MASHPNKPPPSWADIRDKLLDADANVPVDTIRPINKRHRISDEYLEAILTSRENKYTDVAKLKIALRGVIPIRNSKKGKSVVPSNYLRRLSRFTGKRWRQKKALHPDDERLLVKIYTDGDYISPKERERVREREENEELTQHLEFRNQHAGLMGYYPGDKELLEVQIDWDKSLLRDLEEKIPDLMFDANDLRNFLEAKNKPVPYWLEKAADECLEENDYDTDEEVED